MLDAHVSYFVHSCLKNFATLRSIVLKSELEMIIHAFVSVRLDYCNGLFKVFSKNLF